MRGAYLILIPLILMSLILITGLMNKRISASQAIWVIVAGVFGPALGAIIFNYLPLAYKSLFGILSFRVAVALLTYFSLTFILLFLIKHNARRDLDKRDNEKPDEHRKILK